MIELLARRLTSILMSQLSENILLSGQTALPAATLSLRAGPLTLLFVDGDLRRIKLGEREVVRRVYVALRDCYWRTVLPIISKLQIEQASNSFAISYDARHQQGEIDFAWHAHITGDARGRLVWTMEGAARSDFQTNRVGLCVLHPIHECAGAPCLVEHTDGSLTQGRFPDHIAPHQPFFDLRALTHEVAPGVEAEVRLTGDVFEMEDQRNWTDASYKIYSRPLSQPFPFTIKQGERIAQSFTLTLKGDATTTPVAARDELAFTVLPAARGRLPQLGLGVASHGEPLTAYEVARLRALKLAHLRVDLDLGRSDHAATLSRLSEEAYAINLYLEIALTLSDNAEEELRRLRSVLEETLPPVYRWLIFHRAEQVTDEKWITLARQHLEAFAPGAAFSGGTNNYFTELNRQRPSLAAADAITYSLNPQVHAFDDLSLVENLAAQAASVRSARGLIGDLPLLVSPVTLRPRGNQHAPPGAALEPAAELPFAVDPRQMSLFGAAWTLGSLKYLAESGAHSVTYYETTGWRGVMETARGTSLPARFHSLPGQVFPLYHVLADVGEFAGGEIIPSVASDSLRVEGLCLLKEARRRLLLANLTLSQQAVRIAGLSALVNVKRLNTDNAEWAMREPEAFRQAPGETLDMTNGELLLHLAPYETVRVDMSDGAV